MIHYGKKWYSLGLLFRLHGSAIPRALPWAIFAATNTFILQTFFHDYVHGVREHGRTCSFHSPLLPNRNT
jgi:hypothetical protein